MNQFYFGQSQQYITAEYAPSGRSSCRECKNKIPKEELRIGLCIDQDHFNGKYWYHLDCFSLKPRHKQIDQDHPEEKIYNIDQLEQKDYEKVINKIKEELQRVICGKRKESKAKQKKKKVEQSEKDSGENEDDENESEESEYKEKKSKKTKKKQKKQKKQKKKKAPKPKKGYTPAQTKLFHQYLGQYQKLSINELKQCLALNHQSKTGVKRDLAQKCADGKLLGAIPTCKTCGGGKLRFDRSTGRYSCPGYMQDTDFIRCGAKFQFEEVEREKWVEV